MSSLIHLYIFAGFAFAFSIINLIVGLRKGTERAYLFFGIISFCVGIYYLTFPLALNHSEPNAYGTIGLIFFIVAFGFFPWFILHYGGLTKTTIPWSISGGMVLTFVLFLLKPDSAGILWWNIVGHIFLLGIAGYGMLAVGHLWRKEKKRSAITLFIAFIVFALLILDDIIYMHFNAYYFFDLPEGILPFDYYFILFMLIMGVRLAREIWDKSVLEHQNLEKEKRWRKLLEEVQLVVIELDRSGLVAYANPYYYAISGFKSEEIMGRNWFLDFLPKDNGREVYNVFLENLDTEHHPSYDNPILTKQGEERMISWSNLVLYDSQGKPSGTISIGSDITERHKAFEEIEKLKLQLEVENVFLKAELGQLGSAGEIMGKSDAIRYVVYRARQVADTDTGVLIEGETGVGKEVVANFIQLNSRRKDAPYIKINCSALPAPLLESELFGHVRGAFTGAEKNKKGLVEVANGGTLFLDEIGEFPLELQPKLLRFLQDGEYKPVGSENTRRTDVRIIAATNRSMQKEIEDGNFRKDLYYRINIYPITIPPLRNRDEDIPEFVELFMAKYGRKHGKDIKKVSRNVFDQLAKYAWPGNVRELENVIERAIIICQTDTLKLKDIPLLAKEKQIEDKHGLTIVSMQEMEKTHILRALEAADWKVHGKGGAAEILGLNPNTLRSRMKKLNISKTT